jgi:hypothetical protein
VQTLLDAAGRLDDAGALVSARIIEGGHRETFAGAVMASFSH